MGDEWIRLAVLIAGSVIVGCAAQGEGGTFWEVSARHHPPTTDVKLPLYPDHPRLVFRPARDLGLGRSFDAPRELYKTDKTFQAIFANALKVEARRQDPAMLAACWIVTGDDKFAEAAVDRMVSESLGKSGEPYYSNIWEHALAYDWLYHHPALTKEKKEKILAKIIERLDTELADLDDYEMALWHGRNQAANGTMIAALAVGDLPGQERQLRRAAGHYIESLRALQISEGWPEGASYWIYNRAGPYPLAADCVMTALGSDAIDGIPIREVMRKIGLWSIYQYTPAGFFEPYGDSSGSLELGDTGWWELSTDHYAKLSRDPAVMAGADYLRNRSPVPYGKRPYYWHVAFTYDPTARPKDDYDPAKPELWMRRHLPQAMLFGRGTMGVAYFRSAWGDRDETYASFKAGDMLAHHDHYDTGTFIIQKAGLLAPQTGLYGPGGYDGPHRLGYTVQTVAHNGLLILAPGESSAYLRAKKEAKWTALSGGQRVIRPTGFNCVGLEHFKDQLNDGPHLKRADITAWESAAGDFDYVAADITTAYNSTRWAEPGAAPKVSLVTRQFVFLRELDAFVIYDRVETTDAKFLPKCLLHALSKPESATEKQLAGTDPTDGILETTDRSLTTRHKDGVLEQHVLLPEKARTLKIGGPHYYSYVEKDGDQSNGFNGVNLDGGDPMKARRSAQVGLWRTEVEPTEPGRSTRFLNVLFASSKQSAVAGSAALVNAGVSAHAVHVRGAVGRRDVVLVFARDLKPLAEVKLADAAGARCVVLDAVPGATYRVGDLTAAFVASKEGVLLIPTLPTAPCEIRLADK